MQNDECKMQNDGVGFADYFKSFPQETPQFCILHFVHQRDKLQVE
jgi:hypothetical protein